MFDDLPTPKAQQPIEMMSVEDLEDRIADLKQQIVEAEAMIAKKKAAANAAHSVFKT